VPSSHRFTRPPRRKQVNLSAIQDIVVSGIPEITPQPLGSIDTTRRARPNPRFKGEKRPDSSQWYFRAPTSKKTPKMLLKVILSAALLALRYESRQPVRLTGC